MSAEVYGCEEVSMSSARRKNVKLRRSLKKLPCLACGIMGTDFNPVDPAHVKTFKVSQSDHPANIISLCRQCHMFQHKGWKDFLNWAPHVGTLLCEMGWDISQHPFDKNKLILCHPEVK